MIEEIKKFMSVVPLVLPDLINEEVPQDAELTQESGVLEFNLKEPWTIGIIMDTIDENTDLLLLYHATDKRKSSIHHCCFFTSPDECDMFKFNIITNDRSEVLSIIATIYDDRINMEDDLEEDLLRHSESFDFIQSMTDTEVSELFSKML